MTDKYKYSTPFYKIPIQSEGQRRSESQEQIGAQILENQIRGIMSCFGKGIINEGRYALNVQPDHLDLQLVPNGAAALTAILREGFLNRYNPIIWNIPKRGQTTYCYIQFHKDQYLRPDLTQILITELYQDKYDTLLLALVDDTGKSPKIQTHGLQNKRYIKQPQ